MNSQSTRSFGSARSCALALLLSGASPFLMGASKVEEHPPQISYEATRMEADVKTHELRFTDVTIFYGKMTVRADRALATAGDFKDSRWTFDGNVRINAVPRGNLRSDQAVVEFQDNQLKRATATGNPAEFDQTRDDSNNIIARGHAKQIVYEVGSGTVSLSNDAWVNDGRDDIRASVITYDLRGEHVEALTSPGTERVHVTIAPGEGPRGDAGGTNKNRSDGGKPQGSAPQTFAPQPATPQASGPQLASALPAPPQSSVVPR